MKVVKKTGLVPVRSNKTGQIFGVLPKVAIAGVRGGEFTLYPIPEGVETLTVNAPAPAAPQKAPETDGVDIPEDWEGAHHLVRIKLARAIDPDMKQEGEETVTQAADRVIRAEVAKRSGDAADNGENENLVDIPEDWEGAHPNTRIALAEDITGKNIELTEEQKADGVNVSDVADEIIRAELERRAAAEPPAE